MRDAYGQINRRRMAKGLGACICAAALSGTGGMAEGRIMTSSAAPGSQQKIRPVIGLSCPADMSDRGQALCDALHKALQQAAPGAVLRRADLQASALPPGSLTLRLLPGTEDRHALSARLQWQTPEDADWTTGPEIRMEAQDAPLSTAMMSRLAAGLIRASHLPLPGA